mgnify:CR=1 FL=1|tara:strand:- start:17725 stop:18165 length:441 start_codon:yes stop_codon:yes gene_type:complete
MQELNFPSYSFRLKSSENKTLIFDIIRKKYVVLTPEEWVRQHVVLFLINEKKYPASLITLEKQLKINGIIKRTDIIVYNIKGTPEILVECKAPSVKISQDTFDQIARYNLTAKSTFLMVTNGFNHYYCQINTKNETYLFLKDIPNY